MPPPQKIKCVVSSVADHGGEVYSIELAPERQAPRFQPGQFLHLALDAYDPGGFWPESRAFSIASGPGLAPLRITFAVHGPFTARMAAELRPGREVWVKMPYGEFVIEAEGEHELVLCAGGTGITAFTSFLEQMRAPVDAHKVLVAYAARTIDLLVYRPLVDEHAASGHVAALYFVEEFRGATVSPDVIQGRFSIESVWSRLARPGAARYFVAGPPAMLSTVEQELRARDVPPESIRTDAWE